VNTAVEMARKRATTTVLKSSESSADA